jgi:hypothetical protein
VSTNLIADKATIKLGFVFRGQLLF